MKRQAQRGGKNRFINRCKHRENFFKENLKKSRKTFDFFF